MAKNRSGLQLDRIIDHKVDDSYISRVYDRLVSHYSLRLRGGGETR